MVAPDPVDTRLLALVAEAGRIAVHDIAARAGMDVREVAARLAALAASGLPLVVGVECDPNGIRAALAAAGVWGYQQQVYPTGQYPVHTGAYPVHTGPYPTPQQSGPYPAPPAQYPQPMAHPQHVVPPTGPYPGVQPGPPSQPFPVAAPQPPAPPMAHPQPVAAAPATPDPMSTWGPPQSASWARGDQPPQQPAPGRNAPPAAPAPRTGKVGSTLETEGLEGERLAIQLVEVVDPADFLFTAAGYRLQEGERAVVVHTELTNKGTTAFSSLPDLYLVLVAADGTPVAKAPVSLSSRPPHRIGVQPGETAGGHTVYVLPEDTDLVAVRWSPRPDDEQRTLTWSLAES
ncbi:AsnC family protein [Streptoalloteichus tenebrarius]|uniref:AsnC family protein n=1 Tax=Streptoalloteichus tenebrarius (strain ATCC 17920 / DSM 40477 / JCM 4838 / CBS 697.72 / NBRC 16177 / NCIMB 11028 / NRRL B-12390 / A12253. 1 / ISP 5477) TaxID=1933 RepID=UPI0020A32152|nr:AsnC family protein [Streptoalloteichus tenebrarius]